MGYLVCEECNGHYTLKEGESYADFKSCQCGGKLKYIESLEPLNSKTVDKSSSNQLKKDRFCSECGEEIEQDAYLCSECVSNLEDITEVKKEKPPKSGKVKNWFRKRDNKINFLVVLIACILGAILIVSISGIIPPERNLVYIYVYGAQYDSPGQVHVNVDNAATEYIINGKTEMNATITVASSESEITDQKETTSPSTAFQYKVNIPPNVNQVTVKLKANKTGKEDGYIEVTINRQP